MIRVLHYPQVGYDKSFIVEVDNLREAKLVCAVLANYDFFQFENKIKPDYANTTVVEEWSDDDQDWISWYDEATGIDDINEYFERLEEVNK